MYSDVINVVVAQLIGILHNNGINQTKKAALLTSLRFFCWLSQALGGRQKTEMLHKICNGIDFKGKQWKDYCLWRKYNFSSFDSLDSSIWDSIFVPDSEEDWRHVLTVGDIVTDVIDDDKYALKAAMTLGAKVLLNFDYIEKEIRDKVIGYDILDGCYSYSLLTNFGNDIDVVNNCLSKIGLIKHRNQVISVHKWLLDVMPDDNHVKGSRIFCVYGHSAQQGDSPEPVTNANPASRPPSAPAR